MKIVVVGSTGVLGRNVVPRLVERGHEVRAVARDEAKAARLAGMGAEPLIGDIFDGESLDRAARGCAAAVHLATAIPRTADGDWSLNDRIRREGTANLVAAAVRAGVERYVQQSITLLYGGSGEEIIDESAPVRPAGRIRSAAEMEQTVRSSPLEWCILRGGLFYGPGTGREEQWRQAALQGRLLLPGDGGGRVSLVHVVDMARAVVLAVEGAPPGSLYNVVDDEPVSWRRLFGYVAAQLGAPKPEPGGPELLPFPGCSNRRVTAQLGWRPAYPGFRSGLA